MSKAIGAPGMTGTERDGSYDVNTYSQWNTLFGWVGHDCTVFEKLGQYSDALEAARICGERMSWHASLRVLNQGVQAFRYHPPIPPSAGWRCGREDGGGMASC